MGHPTLRRVSALAAVGVSLAGLAAVTVIARQSGDGGLRGNSSGLSVSGSGWKTNFAKHSVALGEFRSGGPPRDGIPPIDKPRFERVHDADRFLADREPVVLVAIDNDVRAYPIQILVWHEIVNDRFGETPVAITFCPLCNSTLVFDRRVDGRTLRFGTTGNLRRSDLVMWDDATQSWWQQFTGEAIVGDLTRKRLRALDSQIIAWRDFKQSYPNGRVLARPSDVDRPYGHNPYAGYDDASSPPFALDPGKLDNRLAPKERVSTVRVGQRHAVVPLRLLRRKRVVEFQLDRTPVVSLFRPGVASALDRDDIASGRDTGTAAAFDRRVVGRTLDFRPTGRDQFEDRQTRSRWGFDGRAVAGELAGNELKPVLHDEQFWFAVAAFVPDATIVSR